VVRIEWHTALILSSLNPKFLELGEQDWKVPYIHICVQYYTHSPKQQLETSKLVELALSNKVPWLYLNG
jgi:hypothetical protein